MRHRTFLPISFEPDYPICPLTRASYASPAPDTTHLPADLESGLKDKSNGAAAGRLLCSRVTGQVPYLELHSSDKCVTQDLGDCFRFADRVRSDMSSIVSA